MAYSRDVMLALISQREVPAPLEVFWWKRREACTAERAAVAEPTAPARLVKARARSPKAMHAVEKQARSDVVSRRHREGLGA